MNHKEKLLEIYNKSFTVDDIKKELNEELELIIANIERNKGVYTVLVTLMVHKLLEPKQDIRFFQNKMEKGFSARTIDTKYITPTLKELKLPSMAESGWLTRSLEQPYPYTFDYQGEISGDGMKSAFLKIIDTFENNPAKTEPFLRLILNGAITYREKNRVSINKITGDEFFITTIIDILDEHFSEKYEIHGGSKLPVLAFYAIYKQLIKDIGRYKDCTLGELSSHTASDRTSKSSGDIEIYKQGSLYEAIEVKLDKKIDINIVRIAYEKIARFNPERYYILSYIGTLEQDREEIDNLIFEIKENHGCQLIVNGLLHTIKYYLRLISSPKDFINEYIQLVKDDRELKTIHKEKLREIVKKIYKL